MKKFYLENSSTKEKYLNVLNPILSEILNYANSVIQLFQEYNNNFISENTFIQKMQKMKNLIDELYQKSQNIPLPPDDCKDYDVTVQGLICIVHNMSLFYENEGLKTWPQQNRDWLMADQIERFFQESQKLKFEQEKFILVKQITVYMETDMISYSSISLMIAHQFLK